MQDYIGQQIDRYRITERLGVGGMAVVYKAYDTRLERDVAVKVIRTEAIPPEQMARLMGRFEREAKAQGGFSHPNIVPVYDYGEVNGSPYLVMAYITSGTLKDKLKGPIPCLQALRWLTPIASALSYAHKNGVVHRDVKPSNILFDGEGNPILTDFGIAKILESTEATLTGTGLGVGTPEYMAPEQWQGQASEASDQYALGVVLYELVTGQKPYTAETPVAVALKQMSEPLPRPRDLVRGIPEKVEKVLFKALAPNPGDRFESMQVFQAVLADLVRELETSATSEVPLAGWEYSEGETVDLLSEIDSEGKTTDRYPPLTQTSRQAPGSAVQKQGLPRWALWVGVSVLLVGLICLGAAVLLLGNNFLGRDRETRPEPVAVVVTSTAKTPVIEEIILVTTEAALISTEMPVPTATYTPEPSPTEVQVVLISPTAAVYRSPTPEKYFPLADCAASQLRLGDSAFVNYDGGKNRIRSEPDTSKDNSIGEIQPGDVVLIVEGPVCNFGWVLWKVETTASEQGWTPESNGTDFWLLPLGTRQLCEGALPSRLVVGEKAKVNEEPAQANLLRPEPSRFYKHIGRIQPGEWMLVLEGPHCGENTTWWRVQALSTGIIGWTMEGHPDLYYLSPEP